MTGRATGSAQLLEDAGARVEQARAGLVEADRQLRRLVRERPLAALLAAVVAGYLVARVARR